MGEPVTAARAARSAIERMLRPRSIAIVGASPASGSLGAGLLVNLERFAYRGDVHLVNASRSDIDGRPCVKSTADLPEGVDCAALAIPRAGILDAVMGCAARGVGGVIVYAAGFGEAGPAGIALQQRLAGIARDAGMAIAGPNCLGHINYVDAIPLTFSACAPVPVAGRRAVAVLSQSGAMATVLRAALHAREVALSFSVSTGNEALDTIEDFLDYLIDDAATHVLLLVVEQFRQPQRFLALARRARAAGKPIVLLHPGRSAAARESAKTHTGALLGDYAVMRALVTQAGVALVSSLEELIDLGELLVRWRAPPRAGPAVISDSGAFKALALDFCAGSALDLPAPAEPARQALAVLAPDLILPTNPLDLTAQSLVDPELYRKAMRPLLDDPAIGSLVLAVVLSSPTHSARKMGPIIAALEELGAAKPVIFAMLGEDVEVPSAIIAKLRGLGVPFFRSPERALRALACLAEMASSSAAAPARAPIEAAAPGAFAAALRGLRPGVVCEHAAKRILAAAGIPVPPGELVTDLPAARAAAACIGQPVALKAQAGALTHKSDAGGVVLGLADEAALDEGWRKLHAALARSHPDLALDGVLVEAMAPMGVELIVAARRDPDWGPVLLIGTGGIFAELLGDVRVLPADLDAAAIAVELGKLAGAALLRGARGAPAVDTRAAAGIAARLGQIIAAYAQITEIEINPLIVHATGTGATAVDALIVLGDDD